eukprot:1152061-Pelagomonas_calceolata.AAC.3
MHPTVCSPSRRGFSAHSLQYGPSRVDCGVQETCQYEPWTSLAVEHIQGALSVDELSEQDPTGANFVIRELGILKREIYSNPEVKLDDRIKRLRQANFKVQYKQRQAIDGKSTVSNV